MNHIKRLQNENEELRIQIQAMEQALIDTMAYYLSDKFKSEDIAHVRTDVLPRLENIRKLKNIDEALLYLLTDESK